MPPAETSADSLVEKFPSLSVPLSSSKLLGLYFASSWCPDCAPVTPRLKALYLSQPPPEEGTTGGGKKALEIVYVSSDSNADEMAESVRSTHGRWPVVPFEAVGERSNLKRHFGACAGREAEDLGMVGLKREYGIPTLIVIESRTGRIVTTDGANDLTGDTISVDALRVWNDMLQK